MLKILRVFFSYINALIILGLLIVHFVLKEFSYTTSLYFYTFPLPVIIIIILILSIFLSKKFRKYNLILASILLIIWLGRSFKIHISEDIKKTDLEIVFWNASHERNFEDVFKENEGIPDIAVLVEYHGDILKEIKLKYPNYYFYKHPTKEIGLFSKTPITIIKEIPSKYKSMVIEFETKGTYFYAVDVSASIDVPREWELNFVNATIKEKNNTVVLGDFNVPYESKYLKKLENDFYHAFNKKGNGFRETWFWNIPLLSLDHIWVSKDLNIVKTKKIGTFKSDHNMLKTYISK